MAPESEPRCPACGTAFLAFVERVPCPSCGRPADDADDIVALALLAYAENHRLYGRAIPPVIRVQTLWDDYLYRALFFLKALDDRAPRESEEAVLERTLDALMRAMGSGWRSHLEAYYRAVVRARRRASEREK
ncbi:MAG TPA: hypothetical protein VI999_05500 [Thermoplasmata archaeon]|nr:hypothetical protein [Thermoplasmata archaeon]